MANTPRRRINGLDYQVGYMRPPVASRFKPGQSGNAKGRPKGAQNFSTVLDQELNAKVPVTENGVRKTVRKQSVIAKQLVNKAAAGDIRAATVVIGETRQMEMRQAVSGMAANSSGFGELAQEDQRVFSSLLERVRNFQSNQVNGNAASVASVVATPPRQRRQLLRAEEIEGNDDSSK